MTLRFKLLSFAAIAGVAAAALGLGAISARADAPRLEWRVEEHRDTAGEVDLTLTFRRDHGISSNGRNVPLAVLQGLTAGQLHGATAQAVRFRVTRDAGTFTCEGQAGREQGSGVCDFEPGAAFAHRLRTEGYGVADADDLLELALDDIGGGYLDELQRQKYAKPNMDGLLRAARHGVGLRYLREMDAAGYRLADLEALSQLRDHGVDPRYIAGLRAAGYAGLSTDEIARLRDHGVSPDFIGRLNELGYRRIPTDGLVRMRDHGVSPSFVAQLKELGYDNLAPEDLIRLRDQGVTASFVRRANADGRVLPPEELIRRRASGER